MDELYDKLDVIDGELKMNRYNMHNLIGFSKVLNSGKKDIQDIVKTSHKVLFKTLGEKFKVFLESNDKAQALVEEKMKNKYNWQNMSDEKRKEMVKSSKTKMEQLFLLALEYLNDEKKKLEKNRGLILNEIEKERDIMFKTLLAEESEEEEPENYRRNIMNETMDKVYENLLKYDVNDRELSKNDDVDDSEWMSTESVIRRRNKSKDKF